MAAGIITPSPALLTPIFPIRPAAAGGGGGAAAGLVNWDKLDYHRVTDSTNIAIDGTNRNVGASFDATFPASGWLVITPITFYVSASTGTYGWNLGLRTDAADHFNRAWYQFDWGRHPGGGGGGIDMRKSWIFNANPTNAGGGGPAETWYDIAEKGWGGSTKTMQFRIQRAPGYSANGTLQGATKTTVFGWALVTEA